MNHDVIASPRPLSTTFDGHRKPLSPSPILDRTILLRELKSNGISVKKLDNQIDQFYKLLHRSGYPSLDEFIRKLRENTVETASASLPTKNSVSSRPGKTQQLSRAFLDFLEARSRRDHEQRFVTLTSRVSTHQTSDDGSTTKIAVELQDGHVVETVLMRHDGSRATLCVSSQVGCAMACTFCATGTMGIRGNLCSGEILEQVIHASRILAADAVTLPRTEFDAKKKVKRFDLIRNVVFMGMGEPLNNYRNVVATCRALIDRRLWNLAHNRVTVSTVGVASRMRDLTRDLPEINLALSLHAPNQVLREKIVPAAKGTPIKSLIEALDEHMMVLTKRKRLENPEKNDNNDDTESNGRLFDADERQSAGRKKRAMIEYVMLEGDTSTIDAAHQLGELCTGRHLVVNLIPYNKTDVRDRLSCPSEAHMQEFRRIVCSYGCFCSIRRTMGRDIAGACGQLVIEEEKRIHRIVGDIEDGPFHETKQTVIQHVKNTQRATNDSNTNKRVDSFNLEKVVRRLNAATLVVASCFVLSTTLLILKKSKTCLRYC